MFCPGTAGVSAERKPSSGTQTFYLGTYDIIEDAVKARKCGEEMHEDILEWYYYTHILNVNGVQQHDYGYEMMCRELDVK